MAVFLTKTFELDVEPGALPPILKVKQYDGDGTKQYKATLYNDGVPYDIPSEVSKIIIQGSKPDGTGFSYEAYYEDANVLIRSLTLNQVRFDLTTQMTVVYGDVICELVFYDSNENVLSSHVFVLRVHKAALQRSTIASSDDYKTFIQYVNLAKSYAVGGTGTRIDEESTNSKYYYEHSQEYYEYVSAARYQIDNNTAAIESLQSQINQYVVPSTQQPDEVVNARVGFDGTVYENLGTAVRKQMTKFGYTAANEEIYFSNNS